MLKIIIIVMATKPNVEVIVKAIKVRCTEIFSGCRESRQSLCRLFSKRLTLCYK